MKRFQIVDDGDTQDVHSVTGQFTELDALCGATIHHIERNDAGRLVFFLEGVEGDDEEDEEEDDQGQG